MQFYMHTCTHTLGYLGDALGYLEGALGYMGNPGVICVFTQEYLGVL